MNYIGSVDIGWLSYIYRLQAEWVYKTYTLARTYIQYMYTHTSGLKTTQHKAVQREAVFQRPEAVHFLMWLSVLRQHSAHSQPCGASVAAHEMQ